MGKAKVHKLPKTKCCVSKKRCGRCPIRMLKEGTLPDGYTVKKRRLVRIDGSTFDKTVVKKQAATKQGEKKGKKAGKKIAA